MRRDSRAALLAAAGLALTPAVARAQSAEAEVLFHEGRRLVEQGKLAAGCDKLEASERLESSVGTLLNLGDCREKLGRFASAWAAFRKAEASARRASDDEARRDEAARRARAVEAKLSYLVIEVRQPVDGLVVRRDGVLVEPAAWNLPVPLDPDTYTIVAEAPGHRAWRTEIPVTTKLRRRLVSVPRLERVPAPPPAAERAPAEPAPVQRLVPEEATVAAAPPPAAPRRVELTRVRGGTWTGARLVAFGFGVAGLGALGAGVYFGLRADELERRADARCPLAICADPEGLRDNEDAQQAARRANVAYVAGGASVVVATVLWLVGGPSERTVVTPVVGDGHAGLALGGSF